MSKIFNLNENEIICYVHYHPSFYHLHVHYKHVSLANSYTTSVHIAIDLLTIIQNIELFEDYYQRVDLEYILPKNNRIYNILYNN